MCEVALQRTHLARRRLFIGGRRIAPFGEPFGDGLLNHFAKAEISRAARAGADEVAFVQSQACGQFRHLDQAADPFRCARRHAQPIPAAPDHFAEGTDGETALIIKQDIFVAKEVTQRRRFAPA